jgi:hypothetical protein
MKKIFFIILITIGLISNAQKQQPDFDGILCFKINKTTIDSLKKADYKYKELLAKNLFNEDCAQINDNYWLLKDTNIKIYILERFTYKSFIFFETKLIFYKNILISFESEFSSSLIDVLKSKYPNFTDHNYKGNYATFWYNKSIEIMYIISEYGSKFYMENKIKVEKIKKEASSRKIEFLKKIKI